MGFSEVFLLALQHNHNESAPMIFQPVYEELARLSLLLNIKPTSPVLPGSSFLSLLADCSGWAMSHRA